MRIAIIASGSRGDVEPYVALGKGLQAAGHVVRAMAVVQQLAQHGATKAGIS